MEYKYRFRNTTGDYFLFNMSNIYSQWTAIVNVLFTIAMAVLIVNRWSDSSDVFRGLMLLGLSLFPVIQPLVIYLRASAMSRSITEETELSFDSAGMHIRVLGHSQLVSWKEYRATIKRRLLLILLPDKDHAYILTNRILQGQKEDLYNYLEKNNIK
ncbi:MAG: hypothetical protein IJV29_00325 [Butyrivibrio sp.]|nr:hypothetical protein [Butyrivibrio sp.]